MAVNKIVDGGGANGNADELHIVDKSGIVLVRYEEGSGVVGVHPAMQVQCHSCGSSIYGGPMVGYCGCQDGRQAAMSNKKLRPLQEKGRPYCPIHKQVMWLSAQKRRWICDGCE